MKIMILGAGSLGSALGAFLAQAGHEVWLVTRNTAHVQAIQKNGLSLREGSASAPEKMIPIYASTNASDAGTVDGIIVLVKSAQTYTAALSAKACAHDNTWVMSLQNGMGHEDVLAEVFGKENILAGKTYCGGQIIAPGQIICGIAGKDTHIGELNWNENNKEKGRISQRLQAVAAMLNEAGIQTTPSDNIEGVMWDKIFINVATGALSGITRLPYGHLYQVPELAQTATAAVAEAMQVARAKEINFSLKEPINAWTKAGAGLPFEFKASILQTLEKNMRSEIDYINGFIVREGAKLGIPTPVNSTLLACIKGIEHLLPK